jgi:hypothetical protein
MKLKEFLEVALLGKKDNPNQYDETFVVETCLYGKELDKYKNIIKECDEFAKCDSLEILKMPLVKKVGGGVYTANTIKLSDLMEFKGRCYLLSLGLTPEMYDPSRLIKPVKNGAAIGPTIYDPTDFTPRKHILLTWSPEMVQDILNIDTEQEQRQILHNLLDDVLDNPDEYKTKGLRYVLVRGLFEVIDNNDGSEVDRNVYDLDLTASKPDDVGYAVYYLEQNVVKPGEIELRLNNKIIPSHLKDKFIDEVGIDPKLITEELIDNFLAINDVPKPWDMSRLKDLLAKNKEVEDRISEIEKKDSLLREFVSKTKKTKKI